MAGKTKVFVTSTCYHSGYEELSTIVNSEIVEVSSKQLVANPDLGFDIEIAFWIYPDDKDFVECHANGLLPNVKVVCNYGVGVNHLPWDYLKAHQIRVANLPGVVADGTADLAFALILCSARGIVRGVKATMDQQLQSTRDLVAAAYKLGRDVNSSTLGIVGLGSVGYKIALRAQGFSMRILYHKRSQRSSEEEKAVSATYYSSLLDMLPLCDFVVIACPLTDSTRGMFGEMHFKAMKRSATLINIARGGIVQTEALLQALLTGTITAAALDVTDPEPLPVNHPLLSLPNVIITPHIGSATVETRAKMCKLMLENVKAFITSGKLVTEVFAH